MQLRPEERPWNESYQILTSAVTPRPIALVSTVDAQGRRNLSPFSFFNVVCAKPPLVAFTPLFRGKDGTSKDTLNNLRATRECVIAVVTEDIAQRVNQASFDYPAEVDEFAAAGLEASDSERVRPARIAASPVNLECKVRDLHEYGQGPGGGVLVVAEVVLFDVKDHILSNGKIDSAKLRTVARGGGIEWPAMPTPLSIPRPLHADPLYAEVAAIVAKAALSAVERVQQVMHALHQARQPRHTWTGVYVLRGETLELGPFVGPPSPHTRIPIGQGLCGKAVTSNSDLDVGDVNQSPEYLACSITTKSEAIVLIRHHGKIVGQIDIDSGELGEFGDEAMRSLRVVAEQIAPLVAELAA